MNRDRNFMYERRAREVIAHAALTNSKRPESFVRGIYPTHLSAGFGCTVYDVDRNSYLDYICGLGTNLLGYQNQEVQNRILAALGSGISLSLPTIYEVELAEKIQNLFPYMERMRFLKTGSEGCSAAVRIARAATGRPYVLSEGYHGWHDQFVALTPPAKGVVEWPSCEHWAPTHPINRMDDLIDVEGESSIAAVIIEPVVTDVSDERINWVRKVREECTRMGALLIFDETITGLRFPGLSFAKWTGIEPDLTVMGKALANGLPLSVVGGRKKYMDADYFVSSTFAGETLSLAAAMGVLDQVKRADVMENLWTRGGKFFERFNAISPELVHLEGYNTRGVFRGRDEVTLALFLQETCKAGILFGPTWFYCAEHWRHDDMVLSTCDLILRRIRNNEVRLEGEMPQKPFAQRVRDESA